MISASEARKSAKNVNEGINKKQIDDIESSVLTAVKSGKLECYIYFNPAPAVIEHVKSLGYEFGVTSSFRNEVTTKISWDKLPWEQKID